MDNLYISMYIVRFLLLLSGNYLVSSLVIENQLVFQNKNVLEAKKTTAKQ